ncbi:UNVERIFIED_CONTAM: hypothetical protein K2H54_005600 [Gekko kuhli]
MSRPPVDAGLPLCEGGARREGAIILVPQAQWQVEQQLSAAATRAPVAGVSQQKAVGAVAVLQGGGLVLVVRPDDDGVAGGRAPSSSAASESTRARASLPGVAERLWK